MQKYLLSLILVFQIKHSLAVCTYKVSNLKLVKIVFSSEFVIFQGNRSIEQFNGAPGDKCANWQARFFYQAGNVTSTTWCVASKSGSSCITATITLSLINDQSGWDNFPALCLPLLKNYFSVCNKTEAIFICLKCGGHLLLAKVLAAFCWHLDTFWWLLTRQRWRRRWYDVDNKAEEEDDCKQEKAEDEVDKMTRWQGDKMTRWQGCPHFSLLESHVSQVGESWNNGYIAHLVWTADHQAICNFFLVSKNSIYSTLHSRTDRSAAGHWTLSSTLLSMIFNVLPATFLPRQMGSVGRRCD